MTLDFSLYCTGKSARTAQFGGTQNFVIFSRVKFEFLSAVFEESKQTQKSCKHGFEVRNIDRFLQN